LDERKAKGVALNWAAVPFDLATPSFTAAFATAAIATAKVFAVGAVGFYAVWRKWVSSEGLSAMSQLIAYVTLPCLIFHRFAIGFDPQTFPGWWKLAIMGTALQIAGLLLGKWISRRHKNDETTMLLGYQNAGFFVLPMLQALLLPAQFDRAAVMLFVFIIFFNASLWPIGNWVLLHKREVNLKAILLSPPTFATVLALGFFGIFHDVFHHFEGSVLWQVILGGSNSSAGTLQLIGDLTVPLATIVLGGAVAGTVAKGMANVQGKRQALELSAWKLLFFPLCGYGLLRLFPVEDQGLRLLIMLEFAAPPAINIAVFCQQHKYAMKLTPTTCLICYALSMISVPFWVALVL
jgi:predicted permease